MNDQTQLLELYLLALRSDPNAPPPPDLDPELAQFARQLMRGSRPVKAEAAVRARVWQRALASAQRSPNGRPYPMEEKDVMIAVNDHHPKMHPQPLTLIAAALAVVLFGGLLLASQLPNGGGDDDLPLLAGASPENDEMTEIAQAATPSATPLPELPAPTLVPPVDLPTNGDIPIALNTLVAGELADPSLPIGYSFVAPATTQILVSVQSGDFQPGVSHTIARADGSGGGGGSGGGSAPTPSVYLVDRVIDVIAGDRVGISVASADGRSGAFTLIARETGSADILVQPAQPLTPPVDFTFIPAPSVEIFPGEVIQGEITLEQPMQSFRFIAPQAGVFNFRLEGDRLITLAQPGMNLPGDPTANFFINRVEAPLVLLDSGLFIEQPGGAALANIEVMPLQALPTLIPPSGAFTFTPAQIALPDAAPAQFSWTPSNGDVIINVGSLDGVSTGVFSLEIEPLTARPLAYGETVEASLDSENPVGYYTFEAAAGDVINVRVEGNEGFDTRVRLFGGDDSFAFSAVDDDSGSGYDPELFQQQIVFPGTYHLVVEPGVAGGGSYALTLEQVPPLSLDDGAQVIDLNSKFIPQVVFDGTAGETVRLSMRLPAGVDAASVRSAELVVLQGGQIISRFDRDFGEAGAPDAELLGGSITVPADGTVTVSVSGRFDAATDSPLRLEVVLE
jgi:hypothetical protein